MPFFWFGGSSPESNSSTASVGQSKSSSHHSRKSSLSLSASGQNARLAEVRSEATAFYLQHQSNEMAANHRRTQSSDISRSRRSRASTGSGYGKRGGVVAIEDDDDSRHKGRIDQGLIDAFNEAKLSERKASWWTTFSVTAITPSTSFPEDTNSNEIASKVEPNINEAALKHRRTVSKTTYRV